MTTSTQEIRDHVQRMWGAVAPAWIEHSDYVDARAATLTTRILELSDPRPGDRVLELACGLGGLGLAVAPLVEPGGTVVLSDVVSSMTRAALVRATDAGSSNVSAVDLDLERIDQPDASYDVVLCREGLMFVPDAAAATAEMRRVLRPSGRVCVSVWGAREQNPWLGMVFDAVSAVTGRTIPPPDVPGPFSLADAGVLEALVAEHFDDVTVDEVAVPARADSFAQWWSRTAALAGPLSSVLASLPEPAVEAIRERLVEAVRPYETTGGIELPGLARIVSGRVRH